MIRLYAVYRIRAGARQLCHCWQTAISLNRKSVSTNKYLLVFNEINCKQSLDTGWYSFILVCVYIQIYITLYVSTWHLPLFKKIALLRGFFNEKVKLMEIILFNFFASVSLSQLSKVAFSQGYLNVAISLGNLLAHTKSFNLLNISGWNKAEVYIP